MSPPRGEARPPLGDFGNERDGDRGDAETRGERGTFGDLEEKGNWGGELGERVVPEDAGGSIGVRPGENGRIISLGFFPMGYPHCLSHQHRYANSSTVCRL